jgi:CysZ protein
MTSDTLTVIGFGALVSLLLTIPVVNWFVMPAAVIGATLMRIERLPFQSGKNDNVDYAKTDTVMHRLSDGSTKHSDR